jgi:divalent metal cation (Fe/Co/Zn/Cd) transporter
LILAFGVENVVDFLSSAIVLWRFFAPELNPEIEAKLAMREKRASTAISFILAFLGVGIIAAAVDDFLKGMEDTGQLRLLLGLATSSIVIFGIMTVFKFRYSVFLKSASLHKDGICSLIGTILASALFINTLIIKHIPEAWWIDPAVALGCGIASIAIGLHAIIYASCIQKIPIFTISWWMHSSGDGQDEITGRKLGPEDLDPDHVQNGVNATTSEVI